MCICCLGKKESLQQSRKQLATVLQGKQFCQFCLPLIQELLLSFCRESASCTHVSAVLHALVAMSPPQLSGPRRDDTGGDDEALPITSFTCIWKPPRKRKESTLQVAEASFHKAVYGCQVKHNLSSIADFDPRPEEYRGTALRCLQEFLQKVKGEGLGVSVLKDPDIQMWKDEDTEQALSPVSYKLPSRDDIITRVEAFKRSLTVTAEQIREIEQNTQGQSQPSLWFSARRYRLTASVFGRILHRKLDTPPDTLVKELLDSRQISTRATEWGKEHESLALKQYEQSTINCGHTDLIVCKAGFFIYEQHPFLGASPDGCVHDPSSIHQFGLVEVKCPYKYRFESIASAAANSDFCLDMTTNVDGTQSLQLKNKNTDTTHKCKDN